MQRPRLDPVAVCGVNLQPTDVKLLRRDARAGSFSQCEQ